MYKLVFIFLINGNQNAWTSNKVAEFLQQGMHSSWVCWYCAPKVAQYHHRTFAYITVLTQQPTNISYKFTDCNKGVRASVGVRGLNLRSEWQTAKLTKTMNPKSFDPGSYRYEFIFQLWNISSPVWMMNLAKDLLFCNQWHPPDVQGPHTTLLHKKAENKAQDLGTSPWRFVFLPFSHCPETQSFLEIVTFSIHYGYKKT